MCVIGAITRQDIAPSNDIFPIYGNTLRKTVGDVVEDKVTHFGKRRGLREGQIFSLMGNIIERLEETFPMCLGYFFNRSAQVATSLNSQSLKVATSLARLSRGVTGSVM